MESVDDVLLDADDKMSKAFDHLKQEFSGLRTGKASPGLVENVTVEYYGAPTRLRQLANISAPEPRLLVINAFDPTSLGAIEKAILAANLGVTPMNDGRVIRIPIPELSEERRKDLCRVVRKLAEDFRVAIRNDRREVLVEASRMRSSAWAERAAGEEPFPELAGALGTLAAPTRVGNAVDG